MVDDHAIVIGIEVYPGLSGLAGPCADAVAMAEWLADPACGDVPPAHLRLLLTSDFHPPPPHGVADVHPVEDEVNGLFRPLVSAGLTQGRVGRRLTIYMAGHGFSDPGDMDSAALYAANAEMAFAPHVAGTAYADWFRRNGVFDEVVLIMDCCRTVIPMHSIRPPPLPNSSRPGAAGRVRSFYAYGTSWGAAARERPMNGAVRGIFTTALIEALRGAPANARGAVTGQVVKDYLHNVIDRVAGDVEIAPPDVRVDSNRDIVFAERDQAPEFTVRVVLAPHAGDEEVVISNGDGVEIERRPAQQPTLSWQLAPGLYKAVVSDSGRRALFEVAGGDVEVRI